MSGLVCVIVSRICTGLENIFCITKHVLLLLLLIYSAWIKVLTVHLCPRELETCPSANW